MSHPKLSRWEVAADAAGVLAGQLAQVHADLVELVVQVLATDAWAGEGIRSPEHWLTVHCALSSQRAAEIVMIARRRGDFPVLEEQFAAGSVSVDQFAVVARHVPAQYSESVSVIVPHATVSQLRRVLPKYPYVKPADPLAEESPGTVTPIEDSPRLQMGTDADGRFGLRFDADMLDGALVDQAIREAKDALFTAGDVHATLADAVVEMARRSLDTAGPSRRRHYQVLVHLDADGHGWVNKKGALPQHLMRKLTCDGSLRPVWMKGAVPVSVGRSQRIVPQRSRPLVEDRDGGCRFPACPVTGFVEDHHIVHWADGGNTDVEGLVSLCPRHHRELHQGGFHISGTPSRPDGLVFTTRYGDPIAARIPVAVPALDHPPPEPPPMKGWPMDSSVYLPSNSVRAAWDAWDDRVTVGV